VGWIQLVGLNDRLFTSVTGGVGFSGLAVALLGQLAPLGILGAAIFFSSLTVGAAGIQSATGTVPASIGEVVKSIVLLGVTSAIAFTSRPRIRTPHRAAAAATTAPAVSAADESAGP
jgi:simple sugar transport system permease protein